MIVLTSNLLSYSAGYVLDIAFNRIVYKHQPAKEMDSMVFAIIQLGIGSFLWDQKLVDAFL